MPISSCQPSRNRIPHATAKRHRSHRRSVPNTALPRWSRREQQRPRLSNRRGRRSRRGILHLPHMNRHRRFPHHRHPYRRRSNLHGQRRRMQHRQHNRQSRQNALRAKRSTDCPPLRCWNPRHPRRNQTVLEHAGTLCPSRCASSEERGHYVRQPPLHKCSRQVHPLPLSTPRLHRLRKARSMCFWVGAQGFSPAKSPAKSRGFSPGPFVLCL